MALMVSVIPYSKCSVIIFLGFFVIEIFNSVTKVVLAVEQELELYTEIDQGGTGLLIRNKTANLRDIAPTIVDNIQSFCIQGRWRIFPKPNFIFDDLADLLAFSTKSFKCHNSPLGNITGSARYLGGSNTELLSISFYSEENQLGSELVVEWEELHELPFQPKSLITMGESSWTVWTEKEFKGKSLCYRSVKRVTVLNNLKNPIGSVRLNCTGSENENVTLDDAKSSVMELIEKAVQARGPPANLSYIP